MSSFIHSSDISETVFLELFGEDVFNRLLRDHSTFKELGRETKGREDEYHIIWATKDYEYLGDGYGEKDQITIEKITGVNDTLVRPRASKSRELQRQRTQDKAEVFTPSWICNAQNNLIDEAWFGRKNVFNIETEKGWQTVRDRVVFPEGKSWQDYVRDVRLEITCGEAPYICSRYDTTTYKYIDLLDRIGLLDRKLRVVSENCDSKDEWINAARKALQSIYGFEWQGDSLLIARESVFVSVIEYYQAKFGENELPEKNELKKFAYIISWNLFQMDGLNKVVPMSCDKIEKELQHSIYDDYKSMPKFCSVCNPAKRGLHNCIPVYIREWGSAWDRLEAGKKLLFLNL